MTEALAGLHTRIVDACEGYETLRELAETPQVRVLTEDLLDMHRTHAGTLARVLASRGARPDEEGSFMQYVHKSVLTVRAAFGGLDARAMPGIRDGEERLAEAYAEAEATLRDAGDASAGETITLLERQRMEITEHIRRMQAMETSEAP